MPPEQEQIAVFLRKANADEEAARTLLSAPCVDAGIIGFHLQQAVEKRLKAARCHRGAPFPRTHDIQTLLDLLERSGAVAPSAVLDAVELTPFALSFDTMMSLPLIPRPT